MPPNAARWLGAADHGEQVPGRGGAQRSKVHVHRGELRLGLQGEHPPVVVSGDGHVVRHPAVQLIQGYQHA